jgi:antitoxin VapB
MATDTERRAKLFRNGRSQAVRLPRDFRFEGSEVRIRRQGESVVLEPVPLNDAPVAAVDPVVAESRIAGRPPLKIKDVKAWLRAIDAFRGEPFMPEGRNQPEMPVQDFF